MLCLSRKPGEQIRIGPDIFITVCDIRRGEVKLGITAPREVRILREEISDDVGGKADRTA